MQESKSLLTVIGFSLLLVLSVVLVGEHIAEAKSKKGTFAITVENFAGDAGKVKYTVTNFNTGKVLGKKTLDFAAHEIEADGPFTLKVSFAIA